MNQRAYRIWASMKNRCTCTTNTGYHKYGGRGITVCEEWLEFQNFYRDMGDPPEGYTLDRIDGNKGYSPDNCRWADSYVQANNTSRNINISYNDKTQTLAQWCRELGIPYNRVKHRYANGIRPPELFSKEKLSPDTSKYMVTYQGKTQSLSKWADELGIKYGTLAERYRQGLRPPELLDTNKLSCVLIEYNGIKKSVADWSDELDIPYSTLVQRYKNGWKPPELFSRESFRGKNTKITFEYEGKEVTVKEYSRLTGIPTYKLYYGAKR